MILWMHFFRNNRVAAKILRCDDKKKVYYLGAYLADSAAKFYDTNSVALAACNTFDAAILLLRYCFGTSDILNDSFYALNNRLKLEYETYIFIPL